MNRIATTNHDADELARAEQQVIQSRQKLSRSLHQVGKSSKAMVQRLGQELKPTLATAAAVAGAALVVGVTVALVRRGKRRRSWLAPQQPSALVTAAKGAGLWALRYVAQRAAQELVTRLRDPKLEPSSHPAQ
jgi:hypothetical protein